MSHPPFFRSAAPRRAFILASGTALLAVVAPGLAQAQAQAGAFPILPVAPSLNGATSGAMAPGAMSAPAARKTLRATPFTPPAPRVIKVSKVNAAKAYPPVNRAARELEAGNTAEALRLYRAAYQLDPTNPYAAPGVGTALIIQGKFSEAIPTFRNYLATKPGDRRALRGLADALTYSKNYSQAAGVNNYILSLNARDYASLYQNAQIATYVGDYKASESYFSRASGVKNSDPEFWASWGESLSYRKNPRAVNAFNRALSLRPGYLRATQGLGDYYSFTSQFGRAVEPLTTVLRAQPNNVKALIALGDALSYIEQPADAVGYYQRALAIQSNNTTARLGLGRALVFAGRGEQGAAELRRVLAAAPGNRQALEALALAQNSTSPDQALGTYQTLLSRTQNPAERAKILASIGDLQLGAQDLSAAATSYGQAAQLAPNDPEINLSYAQILGYNNDYNGAGPIVERVLALAPNNARALALQVQVAAKTGDEARAQQLAANLRNANPATAQEALAFADALRDAGDPQAATALLVRASSLPSDPAIGLRIANATRDNGDYPGSVELYNRLLRADPNDVPARVNLARALYYDNNIAEAKNQIDQVLQLDPNNGDALLAKADLGSASGSAPDLVDAERIARDLLAQGPNVGASVTLGTVLSSRGQFADSIEQYQAALQSDPNNLQAQIGLARNLYYARRVDEAIAAYQRLIQLAPADTMPRLELAQVFLDRNRLDEAEALFNQVLTLQQRGVAAIPAARRASERGELVRLNPSALRGSPLKGQPLAKLSAASIGDAQALKIVTLALAQVKPQAAPKTRLAQSASPTVGVGGDLGSSAPPAASFPSGPLAPVEGVQGTQGDGTIDGSAGGNATGAMPGDGTMDDGNFVPTAPLPPAGSATGRPVVPRVPADAGDFSTFSTPLTPGSALRTTSADQAKSYVGLGEIRLRQARYVESLQLFQQAIQADPNNADAHLGAARVLRSQNNYAAAFEEVNRALAINASLPNFRARILRAQLLDDQGQPQQAQAELDALRNDLPADMPLETLLTLGEALNSLRNYGTSLQYLEVASQLYPNDAAPVRLRAETLNFAGRSDEALALYDQLIAANAGDGDAILGKARVYNYANRLPEAESTYRQALTVQPANYQAQVELADVLGRRGNYPEAIQNYALAIQGNPSDLTARIELARVQRYAGREADAEATLTQVLTADERNVEALTERGILRGVQGSYASAIADLQTALQIAPTNQTALLGLAEVQGYAGQYEASIAGYRAVLQNDPNNEKARTELGQTLSYAGDDAAALQELDAVLAKNPSNITALLARADVLGRGNRTAEAVRIYNGVLAADPRNVRARAGLADVYVVGRRYADAIKIYDQLIAAEPSNSTYRIARARALGYNRQYAQASDALRQVIAAEPDNLAARLAFAEVGTNSGNRGLRNGAIAEYRRLIGADPTNVPARVGLARALSYQGQNKEAATTLKSVLATEPNNVGARVALGDTQRFGGQPFDARASYKTALTTDPENASARAGLAATKRATSPSVGISYSNYNDTNGVRLSSVNFGGAVRTRGGVIGVIAEQGRFDQRQFGTDRSNIGLSYSKAFGPIQAVAAISRLKYDGVGEKFLYDLSLINSTVERRRYFLGTGRRDVYESAQAVAQGITATTYRGGFNVPVASKIDFEVQGVYYRYSDSNSRYSILPALYYRLRPTNPSLRLGLGYAYDDTKEFRNIYYTPQGYSAFSALADYTKTNGKTRYGFNAAVPFTGSTGRNGINRPADTLFGFISRDVGNSLELFANGGIVRTPDFNSDQVTGGVNLWF